MYPVVKVEMIKKPQDLVCSNKIFYPLYFSIWLAQEEFWWRGRGEEANKNPLSITFMSH